MGRAWISVPLWLLALWLIAVELSACTSMGSHNVQARTSIDFGPPESLSFCLLVDDGITEQIARRLIDEAWREEGALYGLTITVADVRPWPRPAFTMQGIMESLLRQPLRPECDRVFALVGRHLGDVMWGLVGLPEVLGAVDDDTSTHGYAVIQRASLNQMFMTPTSVVRHEIYHLLGCGEHFNMSGCYDTITAMKRRKRLDGNDFFPAWDALNERTIVSREAVNARLLEITGAARNVTD
jgi:hypothetical protein